MCIQSRQAWKMAFALVLTVSGAGAAVAQVGNTQFGNNALAANSSGNNNSAFGESVLNQNTSGSNNTASGYQALVSNEVGTANTASGFQALWANTVGNFNTATGTSALVANTAGVYNTATGARALYKNTDGDFNTATGPEALYMNTSGNNNTASGEYALRFNRTGSNNTAYGYAALYSNTIGNNNIALGPSAGYNPKTGSNNIEIGTRGVASDNGVIRIGTQGTQTATYVAAISGVNVTGGVPVMVTSTGRLGVVSSSRRYKEDIRSIGDRSDRLLNLRPVTFRYKQADENGQRPEQYGLIAEDVARVMPELVVYNERGQPETVAYQALTPLLLNELQLEHRQIASQAALIMQQNQRLDAMEAQLKALARRPARTPE